MLALDIIIYIVILHFIADFVAQSDKMAKNKSKSNIALLTHVLIYTVILSILNPVWALFNGAIHFVVDYITSRVASYLWTKGETHNFFVVVGIDQAIHYITLFTSYYYLVIH